MGTHLGGAAPAYATDYKLLTTARTRTEIGASQSRARLFSSLHFPADSDSCLFIEISRDGRAISGFRSAVMVRSKCVECVYVVC